MEQVLQAAMLLVPLLVLAVLEYLRRFQVLQLFTQVGAAAAPIYKELQQELPGLLDLVAAGQDQLQELAPVVLQTLGVEVGVEHIIIPHKLVVPADPA